MGKPRGIRPQQLDAHCWKFYFVVFSTDYILQNRIRIKWQLQHWAGKK